MAFRSIGGSRIIGQGTPQAVPIQLDPAPYKGAIAYGTDGLIYVSNGTAWNAVGAGIQGTTGIQGDSGLQGLQGDYGPGFTIIGSVPNANAGGDPQATLNTAFGSAVVGDGVIDDLLDELWIYDGSIWVNIGSFRGVQGFTGAQGTQGAQGARGDEGIQGSRGFRGFQGPQGIQGDTGIQGVQGIQGLQGTQGIQGNQGTTGIQGDVGIQGTQGVQGIQGNQGTTGIQGDVGIQGTTGSYGGLSFEYAFDVLTAAADPGLKNLRFNNAAVASTTSIYLDAFAGPSDTDISAIWNALDASTNPIKGYIKLTSVADISVFAVFQVTEVTDNTGWFTLAVTYVNSNGAFALSDDLIVSLVESGAQGVQGPQSTQGIQGDTGIQGLIGFQGVQGPQSTQGVQGDTGIQGMQGTQGLQGIQGDQGLQGIQGDQGLQGTQGSRGLQGLQGTTGLQGLQGDGGVQGIQGDTGFQGLQGDTGFQGLQGSMGYNGGLTFNFEFNTSTTQGFPGLNGWLLNNANVTLATRLYIDDLTDTGRRVDGLFDFLDSNTSNPKGTLFIRTPKNAAGEYEFLVYSYSDWTWEGGATDWGYFDITLIDRSILGGSDLSPGTSWASGAAAVYGDTTVFAFIPTGQRGIQGIQGTVGIQGDLGVQGIQGPQGIQGVQGDTGIQGAQGIAGSYGGTSFEYDYTPDVGPSGPATGIFKFNNATIASASILRISNRDTYGSDISQFLALLNNNTSATKAYIKFTSIADPKEYAVFAMTGSTAATGYFNMNVTHVSSSTNMDATYLTNNTDTIVSFTTTGDAGAQGTQGTQGFQGVQGDFGLQGSTGAGTQGTTGIQGDLGIQGVQGFPGPIGPQGIQGSAGLQGGGGFQGSTGGFGGVTFDYTYSTNVAASDPGPGLLKFNNAALASATTMFIDDRDDNFNDIQPFLRTIDDSTSPIKGHFKVSEKIAPANFAIFTIASLTENSGYFSVSCAFVSGSVSNFADAEDIIITFARTGDIGPLGPQGVQGFDGFQGPTGIQGDSGGLGIQGTQGLQGGLGAQGLSGFIGGNGIQGDTGAQGIQGPQGIAGQDGDQGFQGVQGIQGLDGTGAQGIQGTDGSQGIAGIGATGIQGFQGLQGISNQGIQGLQGEPGPPGLGNQGTQGFQGSQGVDGDIGSQGVQGLAGQGTSGLQGVQGIDGDVGSQGVQGLLGDGGFQGTQGFQGVAGEGADGIQGDAGFQGIQGLVGDSGVGGFQGVQGFDGIQGFQGVDGGLGDTGLQGFQGIIGDIGIQGPPGIGSQGIQGGQGVQGNLGIQGFPGQGTQGIQGVQAAQGVQGERGFQGTQGMQGFGPEGAVNNIQNVHELGVQGTPLFITFVEGGNTTQPLRATTGPNPGGESNFYYTSDVDELTVENMQVEGNLTVVGTLNAAAVAGNAGPLYVPSDVAVGFGGPEGTPYIKQYFDTAATSFKLSANTAVTTAVRFVEAAGGTDRFTFNMQSGNFTASGDVESNSDERLKENIETITNALDKVAIMRGVYFDMKAKPGVRKVGLIAQEVEKVLPEVVSTDSEGDNIKSVAYANIVGLLVEAIKELKNEVDQLKG